MAFEIEKEYDKKLPLDYLNFLKENPDGDEITIKKFEEEDPDSEGRNWNIMDWKDKN